MDIDKFIKDNDGYEHIIEKGFLPREKFDCWKYEIAVPPKDRMETIFWQPIYATFSIYIDGKETIMTRDIVEKVRNKMTDFLMTYDKKKLDR